MNEQFWEKRILGPQASMWARPARGLLRAVETVYARAVAARNTRFDRRGPRHVLAVPVISVGNLTVGGTGKTPIVVDLVQRLTAMGHRPAVVSRGYRGADGGPNDEVRMIQRRCPDVICVSNANRVAAAEAAHGQLGADVIVLDDGFQHRRLHRSVDIVLIDATCPFGYDHMLPRGLLREPVKSLGRADLLILTRVDQVAPADLSFTEARLREISGGGAPLRCKHAVTSVEHLDGSAVDEPMTGQRAVLFAGIARPAAFEATVKSLGVDVVGTHWWPDHHHYDGDDLLRLGRDSRYPPHDVLLTTEKDAVKLSTLGQVIEKELLVVKVAIDFLDDGGTMLQRVLDRTMRSTDS